MKYIRTKRGLVAGVGWGPGADTSAYTAYGSQITAGASMADAIAAAFRQAEARAAAQAATSSGAASAYMTSNQSTSAPVETECEPGFYWSAGAKKCLSIAASTSTNAPAWRPCGSGMTYVAGKGCVVPASEVMNDINQATSIPNQPDTPKDVFEDVKQSEDTSKQISKSSDPAATETGTQNLQVDSTAPSKKSAPILVATPATPAAPAAPAPASTSMWVYALIGLVVVGGGAYYLSTRKSK